MRVVPNEPSDRQFDCLYPMTVVVAVWASSARDHLAQSHESLKHSLKTVGGWLNEP